MSQCIVYYLSRGKKSRIIPQTIICVFCFSGATDWDEKWSTCVFHPSNKHINRNCLQKDQMREIEERKKHAATIIIKIANIVSCTTTAEWKKSNNNSSVHRNKQNIALTESAKRESVARCKCSEFTPAHNRRTFLFGRISSCFGLFFFSFSAATESMLFFCHVYTKIFFTFSAVACPLPAQNYELGAETQQNDKDIIAFYVFLFGSISKPCYGWFSDEIDAAENWEKEIFTAPSLHCYVYDGNKCFLLLRLHKLAKPEAMCAKSHRNAHTLGLFCSMRGTYMFYAILYLHVYEHYTHGYDLFLLSFFPFCATATCSLDNNYILTCLNNGYREGEKKKKKQLCVYTAATFI